jgi:diguanylate cyclase (GGDEF)-like protein
MTLKLSRHACIVLALAAVLTVLSTLAVRALQRQADENRAVQVQLTGMLAEFHALQSVPFDADRAQGGSPQEARYDLQAFRKRIEATFARLRAEDPAPQLDAIAEPLRQNFTDNAELLDAVALGRDAETDDLARESDDSHAAVDRALTVATATYERRAERTMHTATLGSWARSLLLLLAFGVFYARSSRLARENRRLLQSARDQALSDPLTGLPNRRALASDLEQRIADADEERPLVLAVFDLDGFKRFNDTFGHLEGDALLVRLARRLETSLDGIGTAYRLGGDEFCVVACVASGDGEQIARLAAGAFRECGEGYRIGASYGSALLPIEAGSVEEAIRLADQRMYERKGTRRAASGKIDACAA